MKKNLTTHYLLILDRSGSMGSIRTEILSAINEQIGQIKDLQRKFPEQTFIVSLVTFNQDITPVFENISALELREISPREYEPNGMTALLDAIGLSIHKLKHRFGKEIEQDEASAVVAVFTDGYENSSKEYSHTQIRKMIARLDEEPNWTFTYVGATHDAIEIAISLSIREQNAMSTDVMGFSSETRRQGERINFYAMEKQRGRVEKDFLRKSDPDGKDETEEK